MSRGMFSRGVAALVVLAGVAPLMGVQPGTTRIDASVVSVSGRSVYINAGRSAGVAVGARVVFVLSDGSRVEGVVADVSASSSRAEIPTDAASPMVNDRAELDAPAREPGAAPEPVPNERREVPAHPPWTRQPEQRGEDQPLLAPAFGTPPQERPTSISGRVFATFRHTKDVENDSDSSYGRLGTWLEVRNAFKDGGRLRFEGDADLRVFDTFGENEARTKARVQRLSYAWGLDQDAPTRVEVGRYFSVYLPEIGLIDGAEAARRFQNGWSVGGGVGLFPTPGNELNWGDDYGAYAFAEYRPESESVWSQGVIGFQQTLHKGEVDRTLLVARGAMRPNKQWSLFGSALIDLYDSDDDLKDAPIGLTQLIAQASYRPTKATSVSGTYSRTTWPQLKREEFALLPAGLVSDGYVDRVSGSVRHDLTESWRLTGRGHAWQDQDRDGFGGEAGAEWTSVGPNQLWLAGSLYLENAAFVDGYGARLQGRKDFGTVRVSAGYDVFLYEQNSLVNMGESATRHTVRGDVSFSTGSWSWDIDASYNVGDDENAWSLGLYVQYRF